VSTIWHSVVKHVYIGVVFPQKLIIKRGQIRNEDILKPMIYNLHFKLMCLYYKQIVTNLFAIDAFQIV